jgi:hypothetical protein
MLNSRIKDHYDIFQLSCNFAFEGMGLNNGIRQIFEQERSAIPFGIPDALSDGFGQLPEKRQLWKQFLIRIGKDSIRIDLAHVIAGIREFILPPATAAGENLKFDLIWPAGGPWRSQEKDHDG